MKQEVTVRPGKERFKLLGQLPNVIVHDPLYPKQMMVNFRPEVVDKLEKALSVMKEPETPFPR